MKRLPLHLRISGGRRGLRLHARSGTGEVVRWATGGTEVLDRSIRLCRLIETEGGDVREIRSSVRMLSSVLVEPIESAIEAASEVVVTLRRDTLEIPWDLLRYRRRPLFVSRPVSYRIASTSSVPVELSGASSAYALSDRSSDEDRACMSVAQRFLRVTFQDEADVRPDELRLQRPRDVVVFSLHGHVQPDGQDHMLLSAGRVVPSDLVGLRPRLIYLDSCRLGISWPFLHDCRALGTVYYLAPVVGNETRDSCTRTMLGFFDRLVAGCSPEIALFRTRRELWSQYSAHDLRRRLWKAWPFRVYRLN
jgi:hypothetical protein